MLPRTVTKLAWPLDAGHWLAVRDARVCVRMRARARVCVYCDGSVMHSADIDPLPPLAWHFLHPEAASGCGTRCRCRLPLLCSAPNHPVRLYITTSTNNGLYIMLFIEVDHKYLNTNITYKASNNQRKQTKI